VKGNTWAIGGFFLVFGFLLLLVYVISNSNKCCKRKSQDTDSDQDRFEGDAVTFNQTVQALSP
jgi:hypothetical protein